MKLFRKNPGLFPILGFCLFSCPIFTLVLLMFCQNPLFGPYRFVSQKSYDNIPSKFLSTIETFFYLCFKGIWEVFQRPPKKSELESPERTK